MGRIKSELEELIATGYGFEAMMDIGNGWEPYEGCTLTKPNYKASRLTNIRRTF